MNAPRAIPTILYTRPGCHLCEDVAADLEALARRWPLHITTIDITGDLELHRRYRHAIPVVTIGERTLEAPISFDALLAAVQEAR